MIKPDPSLIFCCRSTGSSAGSRVRPMFSRRIHLPNWMPNSSVRRKFFSLSLQTSMPVSVSLPMFLMYLLACRCGSIINGQRRERSMMMPFSMESASLGKAQTTHCWIFTGSPKTDLMPQSGLAVIPYDVISSTQLFSKSARNAAVKGPAYESMPAATMQSPGSNPSCSFRSFTFWPQRAFSPPRPPMSLCARASLTSQRLISSCNSFCFSTAPLKSASSLAIFSFTSLSFSCAASNFSWQSASSASASRSCCRLGSTALATK
mmetsp:Transcript_61537/g.107759  ORF Transcript_61537/g.107759 Transcript_61537/m.107759 type:complete len:263 (+) Transcript_61537:2966-3754(+)